MNFMNDLAKTVSCANNVSVTENGARGYATTFNPLVDFNFKITSYRNASDDQILNDWFDVVSDASISTVTKIKYLFLLRDARGGLGERRLFRLLAEQSCRRWEKEMLQVLHLIPEYGRWDDLVSLVFGTPDSIQKEIINIISNQLDEDYANYLKKQEISLLAKWLPSANSHNVTTAKYGKAMASYLGCTPRQYRQLLSSLREYLRVTEVFMSNKQWSKIDYNQVPSLAAIKYRKAFARNDGERYASYLEALKNNEAKVNASVTSPVDIVHQYCVNSYYRKPSDDLLEAAWKNIPCDNLSNTIVVRDGSGSMTCPVSGNSKITAMDVSTALAVFFAEHSTGAFKDKFITFGKRPRFIDLSECSTLRDKLERTYRETDCSNTNLEAVFDMILDTAIRNHYAPDDIPDILVVSDMEFDSPYCVQGGLNKTLFDTISEKYRNAGYHLPRLIFNNVCSRTNTIPVTTNEYGVVLVSGFNQNILKMVTTGKLDPWVALLDVIDSPRYQVIENEIAAAEMRERVNEKLRPTRPERKTKPVCARVKRVHR